MVGRPAAEEASAVVIVLMMIKLACVASSGLGTDFAGSSGEGLQPAVRSGDDYTISMQSSDRRDPQETAAEDRKASVGLSFGTRL